MKTIFILILITLLSSAHGQGIPKYSIELIMPDSIDLIEPFAYQYKITALENVEDINMWLGSPAFAIKLKNATILSIVSNEQVQKQYGMNCRGRRILLPLGKNESLIENADPLFPFFTEGLKETSIFLGSNSVEVAVVNNSDSLKVSQTTIYVKPYPQKIDNDCAHWLLTLPYPYFLYSINQPFIKKDTTTYRYISELNYILLNFPDSKFATWAAYHKTCLDTYLKDTDQKYPVLKHHSELDFSTAISKEDSFKVIRKNTWDYFMAEKSFVKENYQLDKVRANKKLILKYLPNACLKLKNKMRNIYEQLVNIEIKADYKDPEYNMAAFDALCREYKDKNIEEW